MLKVAEGRRPSRDSRRGNGRRGSPFARCAQRVTASETVSRLWRSSAACQPGLYSRLPPTPTRAARSRSSRRPSSARCISASLRTMPTRSCIISCSAYWTWYGPSPPFRALERLERARAPPRRPARRRSAPRVCSCAYFAANSPARLPNTSRSDSELPPSRLAPLMPAAHSPAANSPGHRRHLRLGVHAHAAHDVVRRRPDFHRLLRDVDVGQLLELVIHARQLLLDVLGAVRQPRLDPRDVEEHAAVRAAAARLDLAHDAAARRDRASAARAAAARSCRPACSASLPLRCRRSALCSCPGCRRT